MQDNYFAALEKIANEAFLVEELAEPMVEDPQPQLDPEEVEAIQGENGEATPDGAEEQLPASPEEVAELEAALASAESDLETAKEVLAKVEEEMQQFEKQANSLSELLPEMGAFSKLVEYSTDEDAEEELQKLARERLTNALKDEDLYTEHISKTANEFFSNQDNLEYLYTREGLEQVVEQLASFSDDEEMIKTANKQGGFLQFVRQNISDFSDSAKNFFRMSDEINAAQAEVSRMENIVAERRKNFQDAKDFAVSSGSMNSEEVNHYRDQFLNAQDQLVDASNKASDVYDTQKKRVGTAYAGAGAGVAGASLFGGKKIYDAMNGEENEEQLSEKTANDTMMSENTNDDIKGGNIDMSQSVVKDFLKIAGAAVLLDIANDENQNEELRKEAADTFNSIAHMGRKAMDESFVKVATQMFSEDQLHEIVAGRHNDELFEKIAWFVEANDMSVDELEKVASNAGTVAAKGVAGALTDAKSNVEEKIETDKVKTESVANGEVGSKKADDMRGYNVINNPGEYDVDKVAELLEYAAMQKQAAYKAYVEADTFIKNNHK